MKYPVWLCAWLDMQKKSDPGDMNETRKQRRNDAIYAHEHQIILVIPSSCLDTYVQSFNLLKSYSCKGGGGIHNDLK